MNKLLKKIIFKSTVIIVLVGILAKIAAFISQSVMAAYLGTTYQGDAFYMIYSVHSVVYPMMSIGIWKVFLPLYKEHIAKKEFDMAEELTNKCLTFFTIISLFIVILLIFFSYEIITVLAPGFKGVTKELCIKLVRISSPMFIFIIASSVYATILQCHNKFLGSQIREVASHIPIIITAVFLYKTFGIEAMGFALVVSGLLRLLIEIPFIDWGYKYKPDFKFKTKEFLLMLKRLPSALVSAGVAQLNTLIDKAMASTLSVGTISSLTYGQKLTNVFSGLLSSAVATALYPQMIEMIALNKKEELSKLIVKIINIFSLIMVPVSLACILYRQELVSVAFQRGAFGESSTFLTANIFALYCIGVFFIACNTLISNIFYSFGDTKTPMYIGIIYLIINVVLNIVFINYFGVNGLAFATSLSAIITFFIRLRLSEKYITIDKKKLIYTSIKVILVSAVSCGIPRWIFYKVVVNKYIVLIISAFIGITSYSIILKIMKNQEAEELFKLLKNRLKLK